MSFEVISLPGQKSFQEVYALQKELLAKRIADEIPDTYILCEHTPTITRGRGLQFNPLDPEKKEKQKPLLMVPPGTEYVEIERGGDLTWHGPGQLVVYPIVKLREHDIEKWVRSLEKSWINILNRYGIASTSKVGGSGVWIGERKIMSVGIALKKWVSYHGIAFNAVNDLSGFMSFDPCGYSAEVMTNAKNLALIPQELLGNDWRKNWEMLYLEELARTK